MTKLTYWARAAKPKFNIKESGLSDFTKNKPNKTISKVWEHNYHLTAVHVPFVFKPSSVKPTKVSWYKGVPAYVAKKKTFSATRANYCRCFLNLLEDVLDKFDKPEAMTIINNLSIYGHEIDTKKPNMVSYLPNNYLYDRLYNWSEAFRALSKRRKESLSEDFRQLFGYINNGVRLHYQEEEYR